MVESGSFANLRKAAELDLYQGSGLMVASKFAAFFLDAKSPEKEDEGDVHGRVPKAPSGRSDPCASARTEVKPLALSES